ncbi:TadE family protein [Vallicoccus soli]|uniref:Pilus assembly protein n=1 Tax=Vallicoccus soli TaxID=2339232 RepID=A0A3A3ZKI9_9ACTN|nr:TadE family protein [Vallicoccus soli]RJK96370.1 pilus assembly protein [Vallicoccus soli]
MRSAASPAPAPERRGDEGSAVVETALVTVVLLGLFLAILQLGLALHVRNTLVASAAEGARHGANADRTPADGAERARELITDALDPRYARAVSAGYETVDGVPTVVVRVEAVLPVVGLLGPDRGLVVTGHALREGA